MAAPTAEPPYAWHCPCGQRSVTFDDAQDCAGSAVKHGIEDHWVTPEVRWHGQVACLILDDEDEHEADDAEAHSEVVAPGG